MEAMDNFTKIKSLSYYIYMDELRPEYQDSVLEQLGIELTPLETRIYEWGKDNWKQLVDLLDKDITEETIRDYMIENNLEEVPIEWVVNILK